MNYIYHIILSLIFSMQPCYAMKEKQIIPAYKKNIIMKIKTIKDAEFVVSFPNNIVAISGEKICSIYNVTQKKEIFSVSMDNIKCVTAHPTKPLLAIISSGTIKDKLLSIFNIQTEKLISSFEKKSLLSPFAFNPHDNTITVRCKWNKLYLFNYIKNNYTTLDMQCQNIAYHPKEKIWAFFSLDGHLALTSNVIKNTNWNIKGRATSLQYSNDGLLLAFTIDCASFCVLPSLQFQQPQIHANEISNIRGLAISPNNIILAIISAQSQKILLLERTNKIAKKLPTPMCHLSKIIFIMVKIV